MNLRWKVYKILKLLLIFSEMDNAEFSNYITFEKRFESFYRQNCSNGIKQYNYYYLAELGYFNNYPFSAINCFYCGYDYDSDLSITVNDQKHISSKCKFIENKLKDKILYGDEINYILESEQIKRLIECGFPKSRILIVAIKHLQLGNDINDVTKILNLLYAQQDKYNNNLLDSEQNNITNATDNRICIICFENERDILFIPCHHLLCCRDCYFKLSQTCPICSRHIENSIQVFIS